MEIGNKIASLRKNAGISQDELAQKIYVSRQTISNWENNKSLPDLKSLLLLATCFKTTVTDLASPDMNNFKAHSIRHKIYWLYFSDFICLILVYLALISGRWLPTTISAMLIVVFTIIGLEISWYLIRFSQKYNLHRINEISAYLHGEPVKRQATSHNKLKLALGAIIGLTLGLALTLIVGIYLLDWHF